MLASEQATRLKEGDHTDSIQRENYTGEKHKQLRHGKPTTYFCAQHSAQSICMTVQIPSYNTAFMKPLLFL